MNPNKIILYTCIFISLFTFALALSKTTRITDLLMNTTGSLYTGGKNVTAHVDNTSNPHSVTLDQAYDVSSTIQVDDADVLWNVSSGKFFNVSTNLYSGDKNLTNLVRSATSVVCANNSKDIDNCDYLCDGTADEVEINNAIDALPSTGGMILLLDGTFHIDASITIDVNNTAIVGMGKSTKIQTDDNIYMIEATNLKDLLIRDIHLYGITTQNLNIGIWFTNVSYSTIENCFIENCGRIGIGLYLECTHNLISKNKIDNSTLQGITVGQDASANADYNTFSNNIIINNGQEGIYMLGARHTVIQGNQINSGDDSGLEIHSNCSYSNIIGNQINKNAGHGIYLSAAREAIIMNNVIRDNDFGDTASKDGIHFDINSDDNLIFGNRLLDNDRYEIHISSSTCDRNMLIGNNCNGVDHEDTIVDSGTGTIFWANEPALSEIYFTSGSGEDIAFKPGGTTALVLKTSGDTNITGNLDTSGYINTTDYYYGNGTYLQSIDCTQIYNGTDTDFCIDIDTNITNCSVTDSCPNIQYGTELDTNASTICSSDQVLLGNTTCLDLIGNEWITPSEISDVDDEDVEIDINTYWDIAGDEAGGNITVSTNDTHWLGNITHYFKGIVATKLYEAGTSLENLYCKLTGCTMAGNLDMGYYNITNVNATNYTGGGCIYNNGTGLMIKGGYC